MDSQSEVLKQNLKIKRQTDFSRSESKTNKFLTMKSLLQQNLPSKQFLKKANITYRKQLILGNRHKKSNLRNQPQPNLENKFQIQADNTYLGFLQRHEVRELDYKASNYDGIWQKFLISVQKLQSKNKNSDKFFPSKDDRQAHILSEIMKSMQYILEEQDIKIQEVTQKVQSIQKDIQTFYFQSHQMYQKLTQNKKKTYQHKIQYDRFLQRLNQQKKQRQRSRQISQQIHQKHAIKLKFQNQPRSKETSPIKYMTDLNLTEKQISKIIQKRNKLNLQLDLKFQLQLRKKIQLQKGSFEDNKIKLQKERNMISNRIKQISQKIQFKQKQKQRYQNQKQKLKEQVKIFLKMLLKNPTYRSDGVLWIFRKMIEYDFQPQIFDFSQKFDLDSKLFLVNQFNFMKKQNTFKLKTQKRRKKTFKKLENKSHNRTRVKSFAFFKNNQNQIFDGNLNLNSPPKQKNDFFSFRSKNFENHSRNLGIRKKSESLTQIKSYESFVGQNLRQNIADESRKNESLTKTLMNVTNRKKIYDSTKKYIEGWVSNQGWNSFTSRGINKVQEPMIPDKFITDQKKRAKSTYFKVGRSNTKYKQVLETLFGSKEAINLTARRIKTSRQ